MTTQTILVTGATAGIGRHTALALARRGHRVIATGRKRPLLEQLRAELPEARIDLVELDVNDVASIERASAEVDRLTDGYGVDVLINNAGFGQMGAVLDVPDEAVLAQFQTNVHGLLRVTRAFAPAMIRRGSGRIVNVSSVGGRIVFPMSGIYHGTKYAVEALSDALRMELAPHGISVSILEPGAIRSSFGDTAVKNIPQVPSTSPWAPAYSLTGAVMARYEQLAPAPTAVLSAITHAVESSWPRARYVAPRYNRVALALAAWLPSWLFDAVLRRPFGLDAGTLRTPALSAQVAA